MMFKVERLDNGDGTCSLSVDHVQIGPPFPYHNMEIEHYVREACRRIERELPASAKWELMPLPLSEFNGNFVVTTRPLTDDEHAEIRAMSAA